MSRRTEQLSSVVHRAVQSVVSEGFADPRLSGVLITVTKVTVSSDVRTATVGVTISPERAISRAMHGLESAAAHIRHRAADAVSIKRFPDLLFKLDTSAMRQAEVLDALARVRAEREEREHTESQSPEHDASERTSGEHHEAATAGPPSPIDHTDTPRRDDRNAGSKPG